MLTYTLPTVTSTSTYADTVNEQFNKNQSHYVSIRRRLKDGLKEDWVKSIVESSEDEFRRRFPSVKSWKDLTLCRALTTTIDKIEIDTTLQRLWNAIHSANIIRKFRPMEVMPISVYEDADRPGKYICWDGQHTVLALTVIASRILKEDISTCEVPIVVYPSNKKSEMRLNFIYLNGEHKEPLEPIDIYHQKVFGVRTDGATIQDWVTTEKKQTALENAKMFATNKKFGDTSKPGALTVLTELTNNNYPLEVTEYFCKYFMYVCQSSRPVAPKESWMLYEYFRLCIDSNIKVDDAYIRGVANSLRKAFNDDFDADELYDVALCSWQEWFRKNKPNPDGSLLGIYYSEKKIGVTFLLEQIRKNFKGAVPVLSNPFWPVPKGDLL